MQFQPLRVLPYPRVDKPNKADRVPILLRDGGISMELWVALYAPCQSRMTVRWKKPGYKAAICLGSDVVFGVRRLDSRCTEIDVYDVDFEYAAKHLRGKVVRVKGIKAWRWHDQLDANELRQKVADLLLQSMLETVQ